jgi:hypothetical protein
MTASAKTARKTTPPAARAIGRIPDELDIANVPAITKTPVWPPRRAKAIGHTKQWWDNRVRC